MDNILRFLGIAKKAGKLALGEEPVGFATKTRTCFLILIAKDAAENTMRRASRLSQSENVLFLILPYTKEELGQATGRSSLAILAFTDIGLAKAIVKKLFAFYGTSTYREAVTILEERSTHFIQQRQTEQRVSKKKRYK